MVSGQTGGVVAGKRAGMIEGREADGLMNGGQTGSEAKRGFSAAVIADGFDGATFHGFLALGFFFRRFGLLFHEGITAIVIARKILRRGFAAKVAIDTLVIDVVFARDVFRVSIRNISHNQVCPNREAILRLAVKISRSFKWKA